MRKLAALIVGLDETAYDFFRNYFSDQNANPHTLMTTSCLAYLSASISKGCRCQLTGYVWSNSLCGVREGHEGIVKSLLSPADAAVNTATNLGTFVKPSWRTALFATSENGHEGVVKLLLSK